MEAYNAYLSVGGNPHELSPAIFNPKIDSAQRKLYDTRKTGGPIRRIRDRKDLLCCPMCGSGTTGHVDHYLPRTEYPEFSIFSANLVPTCPHCNSSEKGDLVKGQAPARFIHPYFDTLAHNPLWRVGFIPPFEMTAFVPEVMPDLDGDDAVRVKFHLEHVLGRQFRLTMANKWATFPNYLCKEAVKGFIPETFVELEIDKLRRYAEVTNGLNSWEAAFMRGLAVNGDARRWIMHQAGALAATNPETTPRGPA